jgi:ABC-2 type transport system ATP-binding protein
MSGPSIQLDGVRVTYGGTTVLALDGATIPRGTTALLGPNGAGKTSLLQLLATVTAPSAGTIAVGGFDIGLSDHQRSLRARLGYASQLDQLPPRMRVSEYCDYVAALKEIGPRRVRSRWASYILELVGLTDVAQDRIGTLSGGTRRRLVLAQSLLGHPDLLILDEPLVSLDAAHRSSIVRLIAASAQTRTTVVATHHSDELAAVCGHVMVLVHGRLAFAGDPASLAARARGQVWETATPLDHPEVRALGPDRFRIVGSPPAGGVAVEPTVHDGYLAVLHQVSETV